MKFLFTVHQFFPDFSAGTEVLTLSVARELRARGHEVRLLSGYPAPVPPSDTQRFDSYRYDDFLVYRFHHSYESSDAQQSSLALGYDNQAAAAYFARILQDYQPDLVHFFHLNRLGTGLIDEAVQRDIPACMSPTDFWLICPTATLMLDDGEACSGPSRNAGNCVRHFAGSAKVGRQSLAGQVVRRLPVAALDSLAAWTASGRLPAYPQSHEVAAMQRRLGLNIARLNRLRKIVVPTETMRQALERHGVAPQRIVRLAYGVDAPARVPRQYPAPLERPLRVGFIGTLVAHKGAHVLLQAVRGLPTGQVELALYGSPAEHPDYAAELARVAQGANPVRFLGTFPNAQIGAVLADMDVLVVPSLWQENTPLVIHSALAAGCPVVGSDVAGIAELVREGHNGLLFKPGDADALARQLARLRAQPGLLQDLSDHCQPVQTTAAYVDAMLVHWTQPQPTEN